VMLQPRYIIAPATSSPRVDTVVDLTQPEMYVPAQPDVDTNGMLASFAGAAPKDWDDEVFIDYNGGGA